MPIYNYQCGVCKKTYEKTVIGGDVPSIPCEECGKDAEKIMSAPSLPRQGSQGTESPLECVLHGILFEGGSGEPLGVIHFVRDKRTIN